MESRKSKDGVCTFPDSSAGCPFFMFQSDLLECHKVVCELAFAFVDSGIGTLECEEVRQQRCNEVAWSSY